jgi:lipid-A-disaccharide synthase
MGHRIFFSVGDPSGDLHASRLIAAWKSIDPTIAFRGFGGPQMEVAGCRIDLRLTDHAVMGFAEVLPKLRDFFRFADQAEAIFAEREVDAVVLVDFPGFNWHIAKRAKAKGIPVYYYLPPQLWAWGGWRIGKMRRTVDCVLASLPMEVDYYRKAGMPVVSVGHPFFDHVAQQTLDQRWMADHRPVDRVHVALLPGSRSHEVRHNWPWQLAVLRRLSQTTKTPLHFSVAALKENHARWCQDQCLDLDRSLSISFSVGKTSEILAMADCALSKSGSVSLELMARGVPTAIIYRVSAPTYLIGRTLSPLRSMTLPNLIAGEILMPEFLSVRLGETQIRQVSDAMTPWIEDPQARERQRTRLLELTGRIGAPGASFRAAEALNQLIQGTNSASQHVA